MASKKSAPKRKPTAPKSKKPTAPKSKGKKRTKSAASKRRMASMYKDGKICDSASFKRVVINPVTGAEIKGDLMINLDAVEVGRTGFTLDTKYLATTVCNNEGKLFPKNSFEDYINKASELLLIENSKESLSLCEVMKFHGVVVDPRICAKTMEWNKNDDVRIIKAPVSVVNWMCYYILTNEFNEPVKDYSCCGEKMSWPSKKCLKSYEKYMIKKEKVSSLAYQIKAANPFDVSFTEYKDMLKPYIPTGIKKTMKKYKAFYETMKKQDKAEILKSAALIKLCKSKSKEDKLMRMLLKKKGIDAGNDKGLGFSCSPFSYASSMINAIESIDSM